MVKLQQCIDCGREWKRAYQKTVRLLSKNTDRPWTFPVTQTAKSLQSVCGMLKSSYVCHQHSFLATFLPCSSLPLKDLRGDLFSLFLHVCFTVKPGPVQISRAFRVQVGVRTSCSPPGRKHFSADRCIRPTLLRPFGGLPRTSAICLPFLCCSIEVQMGHYGILGRHLKASGNRNMSVRFPRPSHACFRRHQSRHFALC